MVDAVQRIDVRTGRARVAGHLPRPLGHGVAVGLGGRVLLVGGRTSADRLTARMWWFRPDTVGFTSAGHLPTPLADSAAIGRGSTAYLVGGERPGFSDRVLRLSWR
jgi:N-acetylneuraminic acid mutarotase